MWILLTALIGIAVVAFLAGYIRNKYLQRKIARGELDRMPETKVADVECCGRHAFCEKKIIPANVLNKPEYYDDEELDQYAGIASGDYTPEQIDQFREVLRTMKPTEVEGWRCSLHQRGINLPDAIKD